MKKRMLLCGLVAAGLTQASMGQASHRRSPGETGVVERGVPLNGADVCANAPFISGFGQFPFDNSNALTDGMPHALCSKDGGAQIARDLWWRWESPVTGPVTISTCGLTGVDTEIAVYGPQAVCAPGDAFLIFCDDQNCGDQTEITFLAIAGQEYLFRIGSFDGFGGMNPAVGGPGEFRLSSPGVSPCQPAYCQEFDAGLSIGAISDDDSQVADDFTTDMNALVCFVCVKGDYDSEGPNPTNSDEFQVRYFADNGGVPGRVLAVFNQGSDLLVEGPAPTGEVVEGQYTQFEYKLKHLPLPVAAGQRVWVEVRNQIPLWFWSSSPEGNGTSYQRFSGVGAYSAGDKVNRDMAMCVGPIETCPTDVNNDGVTNFADLNLVVSFFNTVCP